MHHYSLRDVAASLIGLVCKRFGDSSHTLRPRITRTCLKHFLDPSKPFGTHYGAITGLATIGGRESVRVLILPNLKLYENVLKPELENDSPKQRDAEMVLEAILSGLKKLEEPDAELLVKHENSIIGEDMKTRLVEKVGDILAERVWRLGRSSLIRAIVDAQMASI